MSAAARSPELLRNLRDLRSEDLLTDEQYEREVAKVLAEMPAAASAGDQGGAMGDVASALRAVATAIGC
jgi:hypothetical protein